MKLRQAAWGRAVQAGKSQRRGAPERKECVGDQCDRGRLPPDGLPKAGHVAVLGDVDQPHPAEGVHQAIQQGGDDQEGHEEAVVALRASLSDRRTRRQRGAAAGPRLTSPMQLPTQGQWWSNLRVQLSQMAQCEHRGGR